MKWKSFFKRIMIFVLALTIIDETNQTEENTNKNTLQTQPGGVLYFKMMQ